MKIRLILLIWISSSLVFSQSVDETIQVGKQQFRIQYELTQGRLNGSYKSYYTNSQLRAEGNFENNLRTGIWSLWDSTGTLRMKREYENYLSQKQLVPALPDDPTAQLLGKPFFELKRNADGLYELPFVRERAVVNSVRLWRFIMPEYNPILFKDQLLEQIIYNSAASEKIILYTEDQFKGVRNWSEIDTTNTHVIGFKMKEDWFVENERLVSEFRIIGFCPVVENNITKDTSDLFWIYFPQFRAVLSELVATKPGLPEKIQTMDDLFIFRCFYGAVYGVNTWYHRQPSFTELANLKPGLQQDLNLIEQEHDLWLDYTSH